MDNKMSNEQKAANATNAVILAIQNAAVDPAQAKKMLAEFHTEMRETWQGYFLALFNHNVAGVENFQPLQINHNSEIEIPTSEIN